MTEFILAFTACFIILALADTRSALKLYIFLVPFMPRYFALAVGDSALALSLSRLLAYSLGLSFLFIIIIYRKAAADALIKMRSDWLAISVVAIYLVKVISTLSYSGPGKLPYVVDDFLTAGIFLFTAYFLINRPKDINHVILIIMSSLAIGEILALIEYLRETPLLTGVIEIEVAARRDALSGLARDNVYRVIVGYGNPLLYSQFVCLAWPFAVYLFLSSRLLFNKVLGLAIFLASLPAVLMTGTRSGILVWVLGVGALIWMLVWHKSRGFFRYAVVAVALAVLAVGLIQIKNIVQDPTEYFAASERGLSSVKGRIAQYGMVASALSSRPILGVGLLQNYRRDLDELGGLDNYWLRITLEGGLIGLTLFLFFCFVLLFRSFTLFRQSAASRERLLWACITVSAGSQFFHMLFVSMPNNNIFLYVIAGILIRFGSASERITKMQAVGDIQLVQRQ